MPTMQQIISFLDKELDIKHIPDSSKNGLQVISSRKYLNKEVRNIGFAVDACVTTFEKAKKAGVDLLIVHHGILWKGKKHTQNPKYNNLRIAFLKKNNIALYAAHLPIDKHDKYGNNIGLAKIIGLKKIKRFGAYKGHAIGYSGMLPKKASLEEVSARLSKSLKTKCRFVRALGRKSNTIKTICICSGKGTSLIDEALKKKFDCFVLGETDHSSACRARDSGLSIIVAGHYATETVGVKSLMPIFEQKFNIRLVFLEDSTKL